MKSFVLVIALFTLTLSADYSLSQATTIDTTKLYLIVKHDGIEYIGQILSDDGREVLIQTATLGKLYIPKADIKSITEIEDESQIVNGEYMGEGPFTTRYSFTTNALPIRKGENYALVHLYGPEVHFALADNFSLGVMSTWIASPMVLAAKYTAKTGNEKVNFSLGTLVGTSGYLNQFRGFGGLHFANVTFGSRMKNITLSAGYGYLQSGFKSFTYEPGVYYNQQPMGNYKTSPVTHGPVLSIAGVTKIAGKVSFVFDSMLGMFSSPDYGYDYVDHTPANYSDENYTVTITADKRVSTLLFLMPGMRFQSTDRKAFQVSLAGVTVFTKSPQWSDTDAFPFPMCTWFYKF